ncbi:hypothetical protein DFH09DRAFT_1083182 [Mycena vulgaris]|nr:hypothetical protein DFH09DRAFT_1083182 [Mycena vulgaris]
METVPPEIWTEVFAFACTDDGYTGRALSTVSRASGPNQLLKLLAVLSELSPGAREVKYLFIACWDESKDEGPEGSTEIHRRLYADPSRDITEQALCRILHLVAPSLLALHIHQTTSCRQSLLLDIDLPVLAELTLHGPFKTTQATDLRPCALFPSLRRIHIQHSTYHPSYFLQHIVHAAPLLTHLRVPQRSFSPYEIQVALGILRPTTSAPEVAYLPNSLEELVIEVDPVTSCQDSSRAAGIRANQFLRKLQNISGRDGRVCLTDGRNDWMPVAQAKVEWLEVRNKIGSDGTGNAGQRSGGGRSSDSVTTWSNSES